MDYFLKQVQHTGAKQVTLAIVFYGNMNMFRKYQDIFISHIGFKESSAVSLHPRNIQCM